MKPIIITILTLFILGECFSQNVQSNNSFIFQPTANSTTSVWFKNGIGKIDSGWRVPIDNRIWTPTGSGWIRFNPTIGALQYYNADSLKWLLVGSGSGGLPPSLATLSPGFGLIGVTYDPYSTNQTWLVDTSQLLTINNFLTNYFDTSSVTTTTFFNVVSINNTPPVSPLDSSYYLVGTAPTGIWITHENQVAQRLGTGWAYTTPEISQTLTDISTQTIYIWNGTDWIPQKFAILGQLNPQDVDLRIGSIPNKALNFYTDSTLRMGIAADGSISFPAFNDLSTDYTVQLVLKNNLLDTVHARNLVAVSPLSLSNDTLYCVSCTGGGGSLLLQTNGVDNGDQTKLNLVAGTNVTLADNGTGNVTINASGGSGSVDYVKSGVGILVDSTGRNYTVNVDTNLISTRAWRQKGIDSVVSLIPSATPAALTKTDDANVTLTLGGTPATSLLQATSLTLGWTGTLTATRGGTGTGTVATGDLLYGSGTNAWGKLSIGTTGQHLVIVGGVPVWRDTTAATAGTITGASNLSPLFTTGVSGANITFTLSNAAANTVYGNATSGSTTPSFGQIVNGQITNSTIDLTTKVTGVLPIANGGTNAATANTAFNNLAPTQTSNSGKYLTTDGSNTSWATVSAGGGGLDTSHYVSPNIFKDSGYSDTKQIQRAVDIARVLGKTVYIAWNYKRNSNLWSIDSAVLLYSNTNIILDACKLKKSDSCRDNIMRTANCGYGITNAASNLDTNISIVSYGGVIEGADNPRSSGDYLETLSLTPTIANGFTYGTDVGKTGRSQKGDWRNYGVILAYSKRVIVSGLIISNMEAYGVSFERCRNVWVDNITADMNGYANGDTTRRMANEGTLDFDQSINNITVTNCRGFSQDDFLATNITNNTDSTAGHYGYYPIGDTSNAARDSISNVFVSNIYVGSNANVFRSFIPPNSIHANNIRLQNITNALKSTDPFYYRLQGTQASAIQIGANEATHYGGNILWGQWGDNITADNIRTLNTTYLIRVQNRIQQPNFTNLYKPSALATADVYKDGAFADFKNVTSSRIDSNFVTLLSFSGKDVIQTDSLTNIYHIAGSGSTSVPILKVAGVTSLGEQALNSFGAGGNGSNTAIGLSSQFKNTTGNFNTALGSTSLYKNASGSSNTAIGYGAMDSADGGSNNIAIGIEALKVNTGSSNTAVGYNALKANIGATANVAMGYQALLANTTGHDNTAIGYNVFPISNIYGSNTFVGSGVASLSSGGSSNVGIGVASLQNIFANENTAVGTLSLNKIGTSANDNCAFGNSAGEDQTGSSSFNTVIGAYSQLPTLSGSRQLNIDNLIYSTTAYNTAAKSSVAVTDPVVGIGIAAPTSTLHDFGSFATAYVGKSGSYTLTRTDYTVEVTATGQTMTLPTAVGCTGRIYTIKLTASGSATVATTSSQTIDGSTTYSLSAQYKYVTVQSNNANWIIIANN